MDFFELLEKRRSVRDFQDKVVPFELIEQVIGDAIKAPNAGNMQLWRFVVVTDKGWLKRISDANKKGFLADLDSNPNSPWKGYEANFRDDDFNIFFNAPALVYIVGTSKMQTIVQDCSLVGAYFMLSAAARGLGTCWVAQGGFIEDKEILAELAIPENYKIVAPIIIGYPNKVPPMPPRKEPKFLKVIS